MAPTPQNEGNPVDPAGGAQPPVTPPSGTEGQPLPEYVTALQAQLADVQNKLHGLQKGTDKQIGQVRDSVKRILELKDSGMTEAQIQRELALDAILQGQNAQPAAPAEGTAKPAPGIDVDAIVASLQFEPNDPALAALKVLHGNNPAKLAEAAAGLRLQQLQTTPRPGAQLPPSGGSAVTSQQVDPRIARLAELQKSPTANRVEILKLTKELNEKGWG